MMMVTMEEICTIGQRGASVASTRAGPTVLGVPAAPVVHHLFEEETARYDELRTPREVNITHRANASRMKSSSSS